MLIILLRHGIAEAKEGEKRDAARGLTPDGNKKMKRIARELAKRLPDADAIYSSPLVRAYETAEWVAKAYDGKLEITITTALVPSANPDEFRTLLRENRATCAYFTGHEPHLTPLMLGGLCLQPAGDGTCHRHPAASL